MTAPSPPLISRYYVGILGLQAHDKAAMLGVNKDKIVFSKDLNENRGHERLIPREQKCFCS